MDASGPSPILDASAPSDTAAPEFDAWVTPHDASSWFEDSSHDYPDAGDVDAGDAALPYDPGTMPWELVPDDQVLATCHLDPEALKAADKTLNTPWAVVRYGKLCHTSNSYHMAAREAFSATKTLGALVTGMVAYETRNLVDKGRKSGPLSDTDRVDHWLDSFTYNPDAQVAHVLAMLAQNKSLAYGQRTWEYDTIGSVQINSLSQVLNTAIQQEPARLGANLEAFTQAFLFQKLGMAHSSWTAGKADKIFAYSWQTDVFDMAKIGFLMLRDGVWKGERLLSADWIYRMTHPSFEDANTGYGYLTWLNASANYSFGMFAPSSVPLVGPVNPGPCAPVSIYNQHPHGLSEAPDCNYGALYSCEQKYDVGVWQAIGLGGQMIQGHPGLDLVVVAMDVTMEETKAGNITANPSGKLWDALRPAVINADPTYQGDETNFCAAYGSNSYAPDLQP